MATKTVRKKAARKKAARPRKVVGKKVAKKSAAKKTADAYAEPNAAKKPAVKKSRGNNSIAPNQPNLPIVEDERIPAIETIIKQVAEKKSQRSKLKEEVDTLICKLPPLFKKHQLSSYDCCGYNVAIVPGADEVKIKKAKSQ